MRKPQKQKVDAALCYIPSGVQVVVRKDDGQHVITKTRSTPWQLGHGDWVVMLDGFSGGYDLSRVALFDPNLHDCIPHYSDV